MISELFAQHLKRHRLSSTRERKLLFAILESAASPLSIGDILSRCGGTIHRATVYRTLDTFERVGITVRVYSGWKYAIELSDIFKPHHHHFTCSRCGQSFAIDEPEFIGRWVESLQKNEKFTILAHHLELKGYCVDCRYKTSSTGTVNVK